MGYNTIMLILNDGIHGVKKDSKNFVERICNAISRAKVTEDISAGNHGNVATILQTRHADYTQLIMAGKNWINSFGYNYIDRMHKRNQLNLIKGRIKEAKSILKDAEKYIKELEKEETDFDKLINVIKRNNPRDIVENGLSYTSEDTKKDALWRKETYEIPDTFSFEKGIYIDFGNVQYIFDDDFNFKGIILREKFEFRKIGDIIGDKP